MGAVMVGFIAFVLSLMASYALFPTDTGLVRFVFVAFITTAASLIAHGMKKEKVELDLEAEAQKARDQEIRDEQQRQDLKSAKDAQRAERKKHEKKLLREQELRESRLLAEQQKRETLLLEELRKREDQLLAAQRREAELLRSQRSQPTAKEDS